MNSEANNDMKVLVNIQRENPELRRAMMNRDRKGHKSIYLTDEAHMYVDPKAEQLADKLRRQATKRNNSD